MSDARAAAIVILLAFPGVASADEEGDGGAAVEDPGERLDRLEEDLDYTRRQVEGLLPLRGRIGGYLDVGFFHAGGDGSGIRADLGNVVFPEYADVIAGGSWVFMGDPLSTAVNSRGEPADTGESRAVTHDSVDSRGKWSFIVNTIDLALFAGIGDDLVLEALIDLVPRGRDVSDPGGTALGDFIDIKLAYAEYRIAWLSLFAGRIDPVLGYEYRIQEAPDRLTVTPSLICRYTCGRPIGVKARARFFDDGDLTLNVAVTNGSSFWEGFGLSDEVDRNDVKTVSGRLAYAFPIPALRKLELGVSGAIGAQDAQADDSVIQWHAGADLHLEWSELELTAEVVKGKAPGADEAGQPPCFAAPCLDYKGAYGLVGYRATNWLVPYARVDWRDALHRSGASFIYVSELVRATLGLRLELGTAVVLKAEYTLNHELGKIPQFENDVFTSSLVVKY